MGNIIYEQRKMKAQFLEKQCKIVNRTEIDKFPHLAKFKIIQTVRANSQIMFEMHITYPTVQNKLIDWLSNNTYEDYWGIFKQLVEGLYQMHSLNLIGRCIKTDNIYFQNYKVIFLHFGYYYSLEFTPENIFRKFSTFESDYWLIAAIMWQIITGRRVFSQNDINEYQQNVETYNIQLNLQPQQGNPLVELLISMLQIYTSKRIPLLQLFDRLGLKEMKKFYQNYKLKALVKQFKYSQLRDCNHEQWPLIKLLFYKVDSGFIQYFYKLYLEIQLLIFAFHLSFHYPSDEREIIKVDKLIISKLFLVSKQLKQKVILQRLPQQFRNQGSTILIDPEYETLKTEINNQHNIIASLEETLQSQDRFANVSTINEKIDSLNYLTGNLTLPQRLLIGILNKSKIDEIQVRKITALSFDEIFLIELQSRI